MLTAHDKRLLERRGLSVLHDHWSTSLYSGEPFLEEGTLAYFDGRLVTLCGFPLDGQEPLSGDAVRLLAELWVREREAEAVCFIGPARILLSSLKRHGLRCIGEDPNEEISAELSIDVSPDGDVFRSRIYHRSRGLGFDLAIERGGSPRAEHLRVIELFYRGRHRASYLAGMAFTLLALLASPRVRIVEARRQGRLCGLLVLHKPFRRLAVAIFMAHDERVRGVSDFLYGRMVELGRALGVAAINVGPSPTRGHYDFKWKWSARPAVPPYYYALWANSRIARRLHCTWGPRLVRLR